MTLKDKRIEWKARYNAWKDSGKNIAEWCREQEINAHPMYYWVRQFETEQVSLESESTQWLSVQLEEESLSSEGQGPIFIHKDSLSVEVRPGADMGLLSDIMHLLHKQC